MLIQFSLKNFKCFKDEIKLSLIASNFDKTTRQDDNVFDIEKFGLKLLKSAVVYGANASGKTKLIEGLNFMKHFILNSSKDSQIGELINVEPFLLNTATEQEPTIFEIVFVHENELYRYGFEIDSKKIHTEWLYYRKKNEDIELFYRDEQDFEVHPIFKVHDLVENNRIRPNALLLSVAAHWNDASAKKVFEGLKKINGISGLKEESYEEFSIVKMQKNKKDTLHFLKIADLGIENIQIKKIDSSNLPNYVPNAVKEFLKKNRDIEVFSDIITYHKKYDENNLPKGFTPFTMKDYESSGTKKYFALSGPILDTLQQGSVLIVDELANKLHPHLVYELIALFNSKEKNPKNAQLIFNTHNTNLLNSGLFRKDQIWFTEKDRYGAVNLFSLADFKKVRKDENFEKNYDEGKYGAIPYLKGFKKLSTF